MGAILYPPKGVTFEDWMCDMMCGRPEDDGEWDDWEDDLDDWADENSDYNPRADY